jgi:hypothetical protein
MKDKIVMNVYQTHDFDYFTRLENNRGRLETDGVSKSRLNYLQWIYDAGEWIRAHCLVEINAAGWILDGLHNFDFCKLNGLPVWYFINDEPRYNARHGKFHVLNEVMKRNRIDTTWSNDEIFKCALNSKECPLAEVISKKISETDGAFHWYELLAVVAKEQKYFYGRKKDFDLTVFQNDDLLKYARSQEFKIEQEYFLKFCKHLSTATQRKNLLSFIYGVIWYESNEVIKKVKFRQSVFKLPEDFLKSHRHTRDAISIRNKLIGTYNTSFGESVNPRAVIYLPKHSDVVSRDKKKVA